MHIVEAEAMNYKGSPIKITLAPGNICTANTFPWGFEIIPPMILKLKYVSGPMHISKQYLVVVEENPNQKRRKI